MTQDEKIEKLSEFVRYYANCPCCDQDGKCADNCTFAHDDAVEHDVMIQAREVLEATK